MVSRPVNIYRCPFADFDFDSEREIGTWAWNAWNEEVHECESTDVCMKGKKDRRTNGGLVLEMVVFLSVIPKHTQHMCCI